MPSNDTAWLSDEVERAAEKPAVRSKTPNPKAPQLARVHREPPRKQKALYLQESYIEAFDLLVFNEKKKVKGNPAPKLAEEALHLLFEKYGLDINSL